MTEEPNREVRAAGRPRRIITMTLSLEWLLGAAMAAVIFASTLWFGQKQQTQQLAELTIAVNSGNTAYNVLSGKLTLLEYRMGVYEAQLKAIQDGKGKP